MADNTTELWQAVTELRDRHATLESRVAAHDVRHEMLLAEFRESRQERQRQMEGITGTLAEIREKVSEAHGAAKFGKWMVGLLVSLGVPAALFAWYSGGPPQ